MTDVQWPRRVDAGELNLETFAAADVAGPVSGVDLADKEEELRGLEARWEREKSALEGSGALRKQIDTLRVEAERLQREGDLASTFALPSSRSGISPSTPSLRTAATSAS